MGELDRGVVSEPTTTECERRQGAPRWGHSRRRRWLAAGIAALLGALGAICADVASGWSTTTDTPMATALSLGIDDVTALLLVKSPQSLLWGHYLAIVFIPFGILGIWHVSVLLRAAGRQWSSWFLVSGSFTFAAGTAYHSTYGFVATVLRTKDERLIAEIAPFFEPFGTLMIVAIVVTMIPLIMGILSGKTVYPRWVAAVTPLPLQLGLSAVAMLLPAAAANFVIVTGLNASMALFLAVSLLTTGSRVGTGGLYTS